MQQTLTIIKRNDPMNTLWISLRMLATLTLLTGLMYPLAVTGVAQIVMPVQAQGSLIRRDGRPVGSELLAQPTQNGRYFWPRPSAADYATVASGASNKGPTSKDLQQKIVERQQFLRKAHGLSAAAPVPDELVLASGSGLDPHISPEAAYFQAARVARARQVDETQLRTLIAAQIVPRQWGLFGEPRVNVLRLNLALENLDVQP
jgi:K+-transporting ATPase ATPase C chain